MIKNKLLIEKIDIIDIIVLFDFASHNCLPILSAVVFIVCILGWKIKQNYKFFSSIFFSGKFIFIISSSSHLSNQPIKSTTF